MLEEEELHFNAVNEAVAEPMRALIHGFPGAGKSKVIHWLRDLFETVLGWQHGVEFVCLAPLNTMAALIKGNTLHSWGEIPINADQAARNSASRHVARDITTLSTKCSAMRWLLVDEIEAVGCELLATLDTNLRCAVAAKNTYKKRPRRKDAKTKARAEQRLWGGINFVAFGDFWQIPPVKATALYANPFKKHLQGAMRILMNFWTDRPDGITHLFELPVNMRSGDDIWFSALVTECRNGQLTDRMYNLSLIHI